MIPVDQLPGAQVSTLFTDIDDTLTTSGRLDAKTYSALEALQCTGMRVVVVTGRPAGWCDLIARLWPVEGVIGENGAFYKWRDPHSSTLRTRHLLSATDRIFNAERIRSVQESILIEVPGAALASDQFCRQYDLAIDFCEDVAPLEAREVEVIVGLMEAAGMTAKVSSIHVNGWFGTYDKLSMARLFMSERYGLDIADDACRSACVFAGDSPNDSPMFGYFPLSVGVANVLAFEGKLESSPRYVTRSPFGAGLAELASHLIACRADAS